MCALWALAPSLGAEVGEAAPAALEAEVTALDDHPRRKAPHDRWRWRRRAVSGIGPLEGCGTRLRVEARGRLLGRAVLDQQA